MPDLNQIKSKIKSIFPFLSTSREGFADEVYRFLPWNKNKQPHKRHTHSHLIYIAFSSILINILSLTLPIAIIQAYDRIIPNKSYETLSALFVIVMTALVFEFTLKILRAYVLGWTGSVFEHQTFCAAMQHLTKAEIKAVENRGTGSLILAFNALAKLREFYSSQAAFLVLIELPFLLIYLGLLAYLGGLLVIVPILIILAFVAYVWQDSLISMPQARDSDVVNAKKLRFFIEVIKGLHTLKSFGAERFFLRRYDRLMEDTNYHNYTMAIGTGKIYNLTIFMSQFMTIIVATISAIMFMNGKLGLGALAACILLSSRLISPFQKSVAFLQRTNELHLAQDKVDNLFLLPLIHNQENVIDNPVGHIELKGVSFKYDQTDEAIFDETSLDVEPNSCISFDNTPFSGRTTLLNLMAGITTPTHGKVLIDGFDPLYLSRDHYHNVIGFCTNDGPIFQGTIRENLSFFGAYDDKVIEKISTQLGIEKSIQHLPLGLETPLYDSTIDPISPGIKQRIAIARILAADPKILLLDHADSSMDFEGVLLFRDYLKSVKGKKTIIIVSSDKKILDLGDKKYKIDQGKIKKIGRKK